MRRLLESACVVLLAGTLLPAQKPAEGPVPGVELERSETPSEITETSITWLHDLKKAHARAIELGRPLMIDFEAEWCGWCKKLDRETYTQEAVVRFVNQHLVPVKLDVGTSQANKKVSEAFKVSGLPCILFLAVQDHEHDHDHTHADGACHDSVESYVELGRIEGFRVAKVFLDDARRFVQTGQSLAELAAEAEKHLDSAEAQRAYARALIVAKRTVDAEKTLRRALANVQTGSAGLRLDLADLLRQTERYDEAVGHLRQIVSDPDTERDVVTARRAASLHLARCLVSLHRNGEAEKALAVLLDGVGQRLVEARKRASSNAKPQEEAEPGTEPENRKSLLEKIELEGLFLRAYLRASAGRSPEALADMRVAEAADPDGPWGQRAGFILRRLDD